MMDRPPGDEPLHAWDVTPGEARQIQQRLRSQVRLEPPLDLDSVRVVAGVDVGYVQRGASATGCAVAVALSFPALELLETQVVEQEVRFPYVPGLLGFREVPPMLAAVRRLTSRPDVVLVDAQGYAHPRRLGAATHLGLWLNQPTVGCAKSRLVGTHGPLEPTFGAWAPLVDRGEVVGAVVRTREGKSPLYVSPGHLVDVESAVAIARACARGRSIMPQPTFLADTRTKEETRRLRTASS